MAFATAMLLRPVRRARRAACDARPRMSAHHLRPSTLSWVVPIVPSFEQVVRAADGHVGDAALASAGMLVAGLGALSLLPLAWPVARAAADNGKARSAPHAALLLGVIENGTFMEGTRTPLPVAAPPALHGAPAAALVLAHDPACFRVARLEQVYVPAHDRFLVASSRVHRQRFLDIVRHAYQS